MGFGIPLAFYDLREDPGQRINLVNRLDHRKRVEKMKSLLLEQMDRTGDRQLTNLALLRGKRLVVHQPETLDTEPSSGPICPFHRKASGFGLRARS